MTRRSWLATSTAWALANPLSVIPAAAATPASETRTLSNALTGLAAAADSFHQVAPFVSARETLQQRVRPANQPQAPFETHEVVSEYGYSVLPSAPWAIHEVRRALTIDGKPASQGSPARHALTLGTISASTKRNKRLLEDMEKQGLHGAVTDFGQILLLFSAARIPAYKFSLHGERQVGADRLLVLAYEQLVGDSGVTLFRGNTATREPLHGEISMRQRNLLPLRISLTASQKFKEITVREESTVEYKDNALGTVLPISVVHREYVNNELQSENVFSYSSFARLPAFTNPTTR